MKKRYKIVSYEGFKRANESQVGFVEDKIIIVDEAHRLRNAGSVANLIIRSLRESRKVILLTGTPMVNSVLDMSPLVNVVMGGRYLPTTNENFEEHFMMLKTMVPPPLKERCIDYSPITCSDKGYIVWQYRCTYHYYRYMMRQPKEVRHEEGFKRSLEYETKQIERIEKLRKQLKFVPRQPNLSQYSRYVRCLVSYYMPDMSKDYPSVDKWFIKVKMSSLQSELYNKALRNLPLPDRELMEHGIALDVSKTYVNTFLNTVRQVSNTWKGDPNTPKLRQILKYIQDGPKPIIVYSNWIENGIDPMAKLLVKIILVFQNLLELLLTNKKTKLLNYITKARLMFYY